MARHAARRDEKPRPGHCQQIIVASDRIEIRLSRVKIAAALEAGGRSQRPIAFNAEHLRRILAKYAIYYNEVRTHVSLGKDAPCTRPIERFGDVIAHPILGGLHHRYTRIYISEATGQEGLSRNGRPPLSRCICCKSWDLIHRTMSDFAIHPT